MVINTAIESLRQVLRDHGLHATAARVAVLQILREEHRHRSVDEIRSTVLEHYPAIDPATVYRTLETLEAHDLAVRVSLGDKVTRWAFMTDAHHHLVCRQCGETVELSDTPFQHLADELAQSYGLQVDMQHLVLRGLCANCTAAGIDAE